jgi:hypothetical protein
MRTSSIVLFDQSQAAAILDRPFCNPQAAERPLWKVVPVNRHYQHGESLLFAPGLFSNVCRPLQP